MSCHVGIESTVFHGRQFLSFIISLKNDKSSSLSLEILVIVSVMFCSSP